MGSKTFTSRRKPTKPTTGAQTTTTTAGEHQATQMIANQNRHSKTGIKRNN